MKKRTELVLKQFENIQFNIIEIESLEALSMVGESAMDIAKKHNFRRETVCKIISE